MILSEQIEQTQQPDLQIDVVGYYPEIAAMLAPNGIEKITREGPGPWIHKVSSMINGESQTVYAIHLPPSNATPQSKLVMESGGVICYLDKNDRKGIECKTVLATLMQGDEIIRRRDAELEKIFVEKMDYFPKYLYKARKFLRKRLSSV